MQSRMYQHVFRTRISPVKDTQQEFATAAGGYRYTTSVGGTLTGRGGNFIVLDDPMKPQDVYSEVSRKNLTQWHSATSPRKQNVFALERFFGHGAFLRFVLSRKRRAHTNCFAFDEVNWHEGPSRAAHEKQRVSRDICAAVC
jgi:hypothetical protein